MKNVNFVPKDVQRILLSHKISEQYNEQVFYKKVALKKFAIFTGTHLYWSPIFNKNADLLSSNLIKKRIQHSCFPLNIAKFLRTPILKNVCERLFERFPT